jgi:hypothetical protein
MKPATEKQIALLEKLQSEDAKLFDTVANGMFNKFCNNGEFNQQEMPELSNLSSACASAIISSILQNAKVVRSAQPKNLRPVSELGDYSIDGKYIFSDGKKFLAKFFDLTK